jgi:hypothetical protein
VVLVKGKRGSKCYSNYFKLEIYEFVSKGKKQKYLNLFIFIKRTIGNIPYLNDFMLGTRTPGVFEVGD